MTTETRQAIAEMRKRGYDGVEIIEIARDMWSSFRSGTQADALVLYVSGTPNVRHCPSCHGAHHIQQCPEIRAAMAGASNGFLSRFKENAS